MRFKRKILPFSGAREDLIELHKLGERSHQMAYYHLYSLARRNWARAKRHIEWLRTNNGDLYIELLIHTPLETGVLSHITRELTKKLGKGVDSSSSSSNNR